MKIERFNHLFNEMLNSIEEIDKFYDIVKNNNNPEIKKMGLRAIEREIEFIVTQWKRINEENKEFVLSNITDFVKLNTQIRSKYIRTSSILVFSLVESKMALLKNDIKELLNGEN